MVSSAPISRARASFASLLDVAITRAPAILANWCAKIETPPVPSTRTDCPGRTIPDRTNACHAVTPAQGKAAALERKCRKNGPGHRRSGETCSASMPSIDPPSADAALSSSGFPASQR